MEKLTFQNFNNSFIFNFLSFYERINNFFYKDIQVFLILKYKQIMVLALKKTKKKINFAFKGILVFFHGILCN